MEKVSEKLMTKRFAHTVLGLLLASLFTCNATAGTETSADQAGSPKTYSEEDLRRSDWIDAGRDRFNSACTYCHGAKGEGGKVKSFTERSGWKPEAIHEVISKGRTRGSNVMPPWGDSMKDEEIWKVVAYIKSLSVDFKGPLPPPQGSAPN